MPSHPKKIHIASQTYLRGWCVGGRVRAVDKATGRGELKRTEEVAYRRRWWGTDPKVTAAMEEQLCKIESDASDLLREPLGPWPYSREDRVALSLFVAMHVVRSPAWRLWYDGMIWEIITRTSGAVRPLGDDHFSVGERLWSGFERAGTALRQLPRLASLILSMHWTLVRFPAPLLLTSDQPVSPVPLTIARGEAPISGVPNTGFMQTLEMRMPLSPSVALLMSWLDAPESDDPVPGTLAHASSLNTSTAQQADRVWVNRPDRRPTTLSPVILRPLAQPLATEILDGYDIQAATTSDRRSRADDLLRELIEAEETGMVRWVQVTETQVPSRLR